MINNAVLHLLLRELMGNKKWAWAGSLCALLKMRSFVHMLTTGLHRHFFPVQTQVASSWMSLVCHRPHCPSTLQIMSILICTYPVRLMHAWHSNFMDQSRVCAVSSGTSKPRFLYQMKRRNITELLNRYMTDRLADETQGEGKGKGSNKNWYCEVDWCKQEAILKNTAQKNGWKVCGGVDKIVEIALQWSIVYFFKARHHPRVLLL